MTNTDTPKHSTWWEEKNYTDTELDKGLKSRIKKEIWKIYDLLAKPNYSISELNELDSWLWDDITELFNYKTNNIWIEELTMMKNSVLWRLDRLKIDADKIVWENWVTLQECFTGIENPN